MWVAVKCVCEECSVLGVVKCVCEVCSVWGAEKCVCEVCSVCKMSQLSLLSSSQ